MKLKTIEEELEEVWEDAYNNAYERNGGDEGMAKESADWVLDEYIRSQCGEE